MAVQEILMKELRRLAQKLAANLPVSVYLYGSRARGEAHRESDWDLLIIADDSLDKSSAYERFAYPFTEIGWKFGEMIVPLLYTRSEWNAERDTLFYNNIQNDAIRL